MPEQSSNRTFSPKQQLEFHQLELEVEQLWEKLKNIILLQNDQSPATQDT